MRQGVDSQRLLKPPPPPPSQGPPNCIMEIFKCRDLFAAPNRFADLKITNPACLANLKFAILGHFLTHHQDLLLQSAILSRSFCSWCCPFASSVLGKSLIETWNQVYQTISIRSAEENRISHGTGAETLMTRLSPARHPPNKKRRPRCLSPFRAAFVASQPLSHGDSNIN